MVDFKITVANSNLARKLNRINDEIREEEGLSKEILKLKNIMENRMWFLDFMLITYFTFLTLFEKPYWCE